MHERPTPQHAFLTRLVGEWTADFAADMGPDQPQHASAGRERVRLLGEFWAVCEGEIGGVEGNKHVTVMTLGYDAADQRFVGTFVGSMMSHLWHYTGTLDAAGNVLTLLTEGPSFHEPGKTAPYRDVIEFFSDDQRTLTSHTPLPDGTWKAFMTARYRRLHLP